MKAHLILNRLTARAILVAVMATETNGLAADASSPPAATTTGAAVKKVAVMVDSALGEPGQYGIRQLETALRAKGITVSEGQEQARQADFILLAAGEPAATQRLRP